MPFSQKHTSCQHVLSRSLPVRNAYIGDLTIHQTKLETCQGSLQTEFQKDAEDMTRLQELVDELSQTLTDYTQSANHIRKVVVTWQGLKTAM